MKIITTLINMTPGILKSERHTFNFCIMLYNIINQIIKFWNITMQAFWKTKTWIVHCKDTIPRCCNSPGYTWIQNPNPPKIRILFSLETFRMAYTVTNLQKRRCKYHHIHDRNTQKPWVESLALASSFCRKFLIPLNSFHTTTRQTK